MIFVLIFFFLYNKGKEASIHLTACVYCLYEKKIDVV